jgi:hypothetical protein
MVSHLVKEFGYLIKPEGSLPCIQKPTAGPIVSQINPVDILTPHLFNFYFLIILPSTSWSSSGLLSSDVLSKIVYAIWEHGSEENVWAHEGGEIYRWAQQFCNLYHIKSMTKQWRTMHAACMGERRNAYSISIGKPEAKRPHGRPRRKWEYNIKMDLKEIRWLGVY